MALHADDRKLLEVALQHADYKEQNLHHGLAEAMKRRPRTDSRNFGFVWRLLEKEAKKAIKKKERDKDKRPDLVLTG